jgi:hypothetical protein
LPKDWNQEQIFTFQRHFDAMLAGNLGGRRKVRFMPGEFSYKETKAPLLKDAYDEFLARIICYVFSISPEPFVGHVNRATAHASQSRAVDEGLVPLRGFITQAMNRILAEDFASPDLEFVLLDPQEPDRDDAVTANVAYVGAGILTVDEVRATLGLAPLGKMVKYDADQPRVPAGQEGGGQWTAGGDDAQTQAADGGRLARGMIY